MFRTMFHELRLSMEALAYSPKCPGFAKNIIYKVALNVGIFQTNRLYWKVWIFEY